MLLFFLLSWLLVSHLFSSFHRPPPLPKPFPEGPLCHPRGCVGLGHVERGEERSSEAAAAADAAAPSSTSFQMFDNTTRVKNNNDTRSRCSCRSAVCIRDEQPSLCRSVILLNSSIYSPLLGRPSLWWCLSAMLLTCLVVLAPASEMHSAALSRTTCFCCRSLPFVSSLSCTDDGTLSTSVSHPLTDLLLLPVHTEQKPCCRLPFPCCAAPVFHPGSEVSDL